MAIPNHTSSESLEPNEEWRDVVGYEGWYQVSNLGRVKRLARGNGRVYALGERILRASSQKPEAREYKMVQLSMGSARRSHRVHLLVARAFLGECPDGHEVNHIDTDKNNAALSNLEYVTHKANMEHAVCNGLMTGPHGKLTADQITEICRLRSSGETLAQIGLRFGVTKERVRQLTPQLKR